MKKMLRLAQFADIFGGEQQRGNFRSREWHGRPLEHHHPAAWLRADRRFSVDANHAH
jgi:hypothetical protein